MTPDGRQVLVTNWCSADLSVIDAATAKEVARMPLRGEHPRGIAVSPDSRTAYIALMGSDRLVRVDLATAHRPRTTPRPETGRGTSSALPTAATSSSPTTATAP